MARNAPMVETYGEGGFRLAGQRHEGSVLIVGDEARAWPVRTVVEITPDSLAEVFERGAREVEFVLLGVGRVNALPPRAIRDALAKAGMGLEFMDTPAAAQTYNLLTSEGRRLACALIAI